MTFFEAGVIVIINGPLGIGKTSVAWEINARLSPCVMLDGDYIGAVQPFEVYDEARVSYLYRTLAHLVAFHRAEGGYKNFVINYVFESHASLAELLALLKPMDSDLHAFRLICTPEEMERRIRLRGRADKEDHVRWEVARGFELMGIQEVAAQAGDLGRVIDTSMLNAVQTAELVLRYL